MSKSCGICEDCISRELELLSRMELSVWNDALDKQRNYSEAMEYFLFWFNSEKTLLQ